MNLTQVPISMIDTVAGDAGKVLTSDGSTLNWVASASIAPSSAATVKAWVTFDGTKDTTGATSTSNTNRLILASSNVSSVLRNNAGDFTITFTSALADANYASLTSAAKTGMGLYAFNNVNNVLTYVAPTTTQFRFLCNGAGVGNADPTIASFVALR